VHLGSVDLRELARWRMSALRLTGPGLATPEEVVGWLGAVQSQDYGPAKWSVGMRCATTVSDVDLDRAYAAGTILRTHVLRPTWHFVLPDDIRWLLAATAPRVHQANAYLYRQQGLDGTVRARATDVIAGALVGGKSLTRKEIGGVLELAGIDIGGLRLTLLVMHAELAAVICSGGLRGRQHTYALLDERAPHARRLDPEEALAELALRYFTGHGPATVKDLAAWASLTVAEVTRGLDAASGRLSRLELAGRTYWFGSPAPAPAPPTAHLLQGYDEYVMGYAETRYLVDPAGVARPIADRAPYALTVLLGTEVAGYWKRTVGRGSVAVEVAGYTPFTRAQERAVRAAADRYGRFLGLPVSLRVSPAVPSR
jgi:winged helix DNA-binding protein